MRRKIGIVLAVYLLIGSCLAWRDYGLQVRSRAGPTHLSDSDVVLSWLLNTFLWLPLSLLK